MAGPWEQFQSAAPDDAKPWEKFQPAKPSKGFGEQLNDFVADVPRQLGLTARHALEGAGGMADMVASPIRGAMNAVLPEQYAARPGLAGKLADAIGLPAPQNATERVIGDASRMVAGGALPIGAGAALAKYGSGAARGVGGMLAANPAQQLASAGAAGAAGGYTRETGGNDTSQALASLAAGVATPFAMNAASRVGQAAQSLRARPAPSPVQVDVTINNAIEPSGMTLGQLPDEVAAGIRADVAKAMQIGGNLSPDAVRRLADYRLTGLTPTAAKLTLDPAMVTQQENLAKLGINSKDAQAQALGQTKGANNRALTAGLNTLGAGTADDAIAGAGKVMGALGARNDRAQALINDRYASARATNGRSALLDHESFVDRANALLDDAMLGGKLPSDVRNVLTKDWQKVIKSGVTKLDADGSPLPANAFGFPVDVAEQVKTSIGNLQRASNDAAERKALGLVRSALDETPLLPGQQMGQDSIDAFNRARSLNRKWMGIVDKTPALQAVRDGIEPDKFMQQFILGAGPKSNVMDVAMLKNSIKANPDAMGAVKDQIAAWLKERALNKNADEVGNFSQSAYNKALDGIGDRKLKLFFSPDEIAQMKAIGRVASYEQFQPAGSAINNSNTAAGIAGMLDRLGSSALLSKIPFGKLAQEPIQNIAIGMRSGQALDVPRALVDGARPLLPPARPLSLSLSPAMLLGTESEDAKRRRAAGLLFP